MLMSEIENVVVDTFKEHSQHEFWDKNCSTCYSDMQETLQKYHVGLKRDNNYRVSDLELRGEMSAHPEYKYW